MKVRLAKILDYGDSENERILIEVLDDCDLGNYILALSNVVDENSISNKIGAPDKPCGVGRADANPKLLLNDT